MPTPTDIGFRIKPVFMGQAATAEGKRFGGMLRGFDTSMKAAQLSGERMMRSMQSGMMALGRVAQTLGGGLRNAFHGGMGALQRFSQGVDGLVAKVFNLRNLIVGGLIGGTAYKVIGGVLRAGAEDIRVQRRVRRQFGADAVGLQELASKVAKRVGLEDTAALQGLTPMAEAIQATARIGSFYGGRRIRNQRQLRAARQGALGTGAELFSRALALNPHLNPEDLGLAIAEAGTGEEGRRRLVSMLGLNKALVNDFMEANKKGKLADFLGKDKAGKLGIKRGQKVGLGTLWTAIFESQGMTGKAVEEETATLSGQLRRISGMFHTLIGEIGTKAWEKINAAMAKTGNFADRIQKYLESDKGKKMVEGISDGLAKAVDAMAKLASYLPSLLSKLAEHKDLLKWLGILGGGAYVGGKVGGWLGGGRGLLSGVGGSGEGGQGKGLRVRVENFGDMAGSVGPLFKTFLAAYGIGTAADEAFGLSDRLTGTGAHSDIAGTRNKLEDTEAGKGLREIAQAKTLANKVSRGQLKPEEAVKTFTSLARTIEGNKTGPLSGFSEVVSRQIAKGDVSLLKNFEADPEMLQRKIAETGGIKVNIGIQTPFLKEPTAFVAAIMPQIKEALLREMRTANAAGR